MGYLWSQTIDFWQYGLWFVPTNQSKLASLQTNLTDLNTQIKELETNPKTLKFALAWLVEDDAQSKKVIWSQYLESLVTMYQSLTAIWQTNVQNEVVLTDFVIEKKSISLKWSVKDIKSIYKDGISKDQKWIIANLQSLQFIKDIRIPSYQKVEDVYEFRVQWDVDLQ